MKSPSLGIRLTALGKMISGLHKYCPSAIDTRKCTDSVFWGGVCMRRVDRYMGVWGGILAYFPSRDPAHGVIDEWGGGNLREL